MRRNLIGCLVCALGLILLTVFTGNSDAVDPANIQENAVLPVGDLTASNTIGQTFLSRYQRLHAIEVRWILSDDLHFSRPSHVTLHLRREDDLADLLAVSIPTDEIQNDNFSKFVFPPLPDSQNQPYYFGIDASEAGITRGSLSLWSSAADDYPDGQMRVNGTPTDRDLVFRAYCEPDLPMLLAALRQMLSQSGGEILLAILLFLVPGLVFLFAFGDGAHTHVTEMLVLSSGLGLALLSASAIILLWLEIPLIGIYIAIAFLLLLGVGRSAIALRGAFFATKQSTNRAEIALHKPLAMTCVLWAVGALAVLSLSVGLVQIRDVPVPLWVDSLTHAEHIKILIEQNRLPGDGFYHLGYHVVVALLVQLADIAIPQAMLLVGQLLLTQVGLSVFLLSRRLTGSGIAALSSAIIIWFLSPTPLYFVTWGRYPLVLGAALLPIALLCAIDLIEEPRFNCRAFFFAAITFGGLAFAHIRLSAFYALFVVIYLVARRIRARAAMRWREVPRVALVAAVGILLGAIWFTALAARGASWQGILAQNAAAPEIDLDSAIAVALTHHGPMVWLIAFVGAIAGIIRRTRVMLVTLTWYAGLLAISAWLPGGEELLPLSLIVLMGFLPAALAIGDLVHWAEMKTMTTHGAIEIAATTTQSRPSSAENPDRAGDLGVFVGAREASNCREQLQKATARDFAAVAWIAILLIVVLTGTRDMVSFVNPATILFSNADATAMEWIKMRTPADARFLINSTVWFDSNYVPSDGGGWVPYTAGRVVDYLDSTSASVAGDPEALAQRLVARKIEYVYLGRRAGLLSKSDFVSQTNRYTRVYNANGIEILEVRDMSTSSE